MRGRLGVAAALWGVSGGTCRSFYIIIIVVVVKVWRSK